MKRLVYILKRIYVNIIGEYRWALKNGLKVGKGCVIPSKTDFGSEPYLVKLGDRVRCSFGVTFLTHDGGTWAFRRNPECETVIKFAPVVVDDDTFIGARAIIMPGVHIGKNCVIGTGSVVTKDVPDGSVVAGIPAVSICTTYEYYNKSLNNMPKDFDMAAYQKDKKGYLLKLFHDELK